MDFVISFAGHWAVIGAAILVLMALRQVQLNLTWLLASVVIFSLGAAAVIGGGMFIPLDRYFGDLNWNWAGKVAGFLTSLLIAAALLAFAKKPLSSSGLTFTQRAGSLLPAALATALLIALSVGVEVWANDGTDTSAERLWFQATMPGLDEEPFWRGVLLLAMTEAVRSGRFNLFGAEIGWSGVLVTILFGLVHGMGYSNGGFSFSWLAVAVTGVLGFGLYWLRQRTGSVIIPIIAHNLINVSNSFF